MALSCWQRRAASSRWPPSSRWRYLPVRAAEAQTGRHWKTPGSLAHVRRFCDAPTTHDDAAIPAAGARPPRARIKIWSDGHGVVRLPPSAYRRSAPPATRERLRAKDRLYGFRAFATRPEMAMPPATQAKLVRSRGRSLSLSRRGRGASVGSPTRKLLRGAWAARSLLSALVSASAAAQLAAAAGGWRVAAPRLQAWHADRTRARRSSWATWVQASPASSCVS